MWQKQIHKVTNKQNKMTINFTSNHSAVKNKSKSINSMSGDIKNNKIKQNNSKF